jgi:hypothetical protein
MQWKREKYGGIQSIRVPPSQVWTPDVSYEYRKVKNKKANLYSRLYYSIMLMENMKHHLNLMSSFIIMVI